eukprot:4614347-Alexandrium_andersonii.AAC.1
MPSVAQRNNRALRGKLPYGDWRRLGVYAGRGGVLSELNHGPLDLDRLMLECDCHSLGAAALVLRAEVHPLFPLGGFAPSLAFAW